MALDTSKFEVTMEKFILIFMMFCGSAYSTDYFFDETDGLDGNTGLSPAQAWKTITKFEATSFTGGDNVFFQRGELWRNSAGTINPLASPNATLTSRITMDAYGTGENPRFYGSTDAGALASSDEGGGEFSVTLATENENVTWLNGDVWTKLTHNDGNGGTLSAGEWDWNANELFIHLDDSSDPFGQQVEAGTSSILFQNVGEEYWTLQNLTFRFSGNRGVYGTGSLEGFQIYDCDVSYNSTDGIVNGATGVGNQVQMDIRNCTVVGNGPGTRGHASAGDGITAHTNGRIAVVGCIMTDNDKSGIAMADDSWCFAEGNYLRHNHRNLIVHAASTTCGHAFVRNTIVCEGDDTHGMEIESGANTNVPVFLYGNTFYAEDATTATKGIDQNEADFLLYIMHNIVTNFDAGGAVGIEVADDNTTFLIANDVFGNTSNYSGVVADKSSVSVDPQFIDPENDDFRLRASSPLLNAGLGAVVNEAGTITGTATIGGWQPFAIPVLNRRSSRYQFENIYK